MTILIAYATIEGQTGKIARFLHDRLTGLGHDVRLVDVGDRLATVPFDGVDQVILAAPVHERRHPKNFEVFLSGSVLALAQRRCMLLSVSLSAAFEEGHAEAQDYVAEMLMRTGLEPDAVALVAGAVRIGRYDYYATQVLRHVVMRGRAYDVAEGDHAFTDWDALEADVMRFLEETEAA
ncbi:MAG: flavodoxin domain-containing protein [Pseudomonadota bacterium]